MGGVLVGGTSVIDRSGGSVAWRMEPVGPNTAGGYYAHMKGVRVDLSTGVVSVTSDALLPVDEVRRTVDGAGHDLAEPRG